MLLVTIVKTLMWVGVAVVFSMAAITVRDPKAGLALITHHPEDLPQVMAGRYVAFTFFSVFAAVYADLAVIAAWGAALAIMAFADALIYSRARKATTNHIAAGVFAAVVSILAGIAHLSNGAA